MIDEKIVRQFKEDFLKLNKALELKYKVAIDISNMKYTTSSIVANITAIESLTTNNLGEPQDFEKLQFEKLCYKFGKKPQDYLCRVKVSDREFELIGFVEKARKNKYKIREIDSKKEFVCSAFTIV